MEVRICTRCILTEKTQTFRVKLSNINSIWELKKTLEPMLSVAACDQTVYYKTRLLEDARSLSSLYLQEEDSFTVEFPTPCSIEALTQVLRRMKTFLKTVCEVYSETLSQAADNIDELRDCYKDLYESFETCSYDLFIPWNNLTSVANRHFFTQEEGLDMLSTIYKFTIVHFKAEEQQDVSEELVTSFNESQNFLEYMCLLTLWNYSEIKHDRRMVLKMIGLDMFIKSLVRDPYDGDDEVPEVHHINEAAVGCLAQYVEMPDVQQIVADSSEALTKLLSLSSHSTSLYHKEVAANTVFCCSNHPKAALQLIRNKTHLLVMEKMQPLLSVSESSEELSVNELSAAVQYFFCLFLANIQTLPEEKILSDQEKVGIDKIMEKFITLHSPAEIGDYEANHSYVWITLAPFVQLALSCAVVQIQECAETCQNDVSNRTSDVCSCGVHQSTEWHSQYSFPTAGKVGLFSLCHLTKTKENQELFRKEKLVDYLVCVRWFTKRCEGIDELVPELTGFEQLEPPCLQSIAKAYLAKCYGHKIM